jgi:aspartate-semialdehyde dehydrogenase
VSPPLLRVAVVGATGAIGVELIEQLQERRFPLQELRPIATERSLGEVIEWLDTEVPVEVGEVSLRQLDLVFLAVPPEAALPWVKRALEAGVACIDLSGAVSAQEEVPLAGPHFLDEGRTSALVAIPSPPALAVAQVALPLDAVTPLERVALTAFVSASAVGGRAGVDALQAETIALFNQQELEAESPFGRSAAFDCLPACGTPGPDGRTPMEERFAQDLGRLLPEAVPASVAAVQVPTFAGVGISLALETSQEMSAGAAYEILAKQSALFLDPMGHGVAPSTRDAVGESAVRVGRLREDPARDRGLQLWLAIDPIRLAATTALRLAEARLRAV